MSAGQKRWRLALVALALASMFVTACGGSTTTTASSQTPATTTRASSPSPQEVEAKRLAQRKLAERLHHVEARQAQERTEREQEATDAENEAANRKIQQENHESEKTAGEAQNNESVENCARLSQEAAGPGKYCQRVLEGRGE